ncbi:MAG: tetratricopeptide repeat protein [Bradymonadaceae bacterium]|nr:tetratricopeptide repeat protein [Lujinxingiaceae bacterium]
MQDDLETVKAQQNAMMESYQAEKVELTQMIANGRADVAELQSVLQEARDLLQRNNANLGVEIQQTREEVERLRGKSEELEFRFLRLDQGLKLFREDVDLRFSGAAQTAMPQDPDALFEFASNRLEIKDFRVARQAFDAFLSKHARHAKADEATYLLGETYFLEGQWVSAIFEYQKVLQNHSRSTRRAGATYRIGEAFAKMGKCQEAGIFFETVVNEHPGSRQVRDARDYLQKIKSGSCS